MNKEIHRHLKITTEDAIEEQIRSEELLFDAKYNRGIWDPKNKTNQDISSEEIEKERLETIIQYEKILLPINMDQFKLPKFPLVRLSPPEISIENSPEWLEKYKSPFKYGETYIIIGEITQMPGHVIVLNYKTGEIHSGYHVNRFELIPPTEC